MGQSSLDAASLLRTPLWPDGIPDEIAERWEILKMDFRSLDAGFEIWADWYEARLRGDPLDMEVEEKWTFLSDIQLSQSPAEINAYLKSLLKGEASQPLNRVRAIFIGFGGVGKTSLIRALRGMPVKDGDGAMTPGVDMLDLELDEEAGVYTDEACLDGAGPTLHFWDFGGQVMAHATHQFFLREQCLYVIVLDARKERNANEEAEYWLEHVRAFGKNAPVMLVGNKSDQVPVNLDLPALKQKYSNIVDFYPLSCTEAQRKFQGQFERFQKDFRKALTEVGTHSQLFTKPQFDVLNEVREKAAENDFLEQDAFEKLGSIHLLC